MAWADISSLSSADTFGNTTVNGLECELPTVQDFINLRDNTEQGYGVLYGDGATTVQSDMNKVYGYRRDANGVVDPTYGMRGCFVYIGYKQNDKVPRAEHIFFPIGASGYGRRKEIGVHQFGEAELHRGTLRYASGRTNFYRFAEGPLFYDLFKRRGQFTGPDIFRKMERLWRSISTTLLSTSIHFLPETFMVIKAQPQVIQMPVW